MFKSKNQGRKSTIRARQDEQKSLLLEQLQKIPIVQIACEKTGVGRTTFYRWCKEDDEFKKAADTAIHEGVSLLNDMTESQLLTAIRDGNLTAVMYWLNHRHPAYKNRLELSGEIKATNEPLTPEQENLIKEALRLASPGTQQNLPHSLIPKHNDK
jgi:predicted DNA binding protein